MLCRELFERIISKQLCLCYKTEVGEGEGEEQGGEREGPRDHPHASRYIHTSCLQSCMSVFVVVFVVLLTGCEDGDGKTVKTSHSFQFQSSKL